MQDDHDAGLSADLLRLRKRFDRRDVLRWAMGAGALTLAGCGPDLLTNSSMVVETDGGISGCASIPEETEGPYPGDGTNGKNALVLSGIVRSDIRSSFAGSTGTAAGVPLTITLTLVDTSQSCALLSGYAVYLWHCDQNGKYSMYDLANQNYLRGVQATASDGTLTFTTIFPGCYSGRMPHIHFEIYPSVEKANLASNKIKTSQLALPLDACNAAYATSGYSQSAQNLSGNSHAKDMVFSDGTSLQMASVTGTVTDGMSASLVVGVAS